MVATEASRWQHAYWLWPYHGDHGSIMVAGYMVAMDVPGWPWRHHSGRLHGSHGCTMVAIDIPWWQDVWWPRMCHGAWWP